ncbi:MAG: DUF4321 domain-containing protein [Candidatus Marinimicrobia bacterium]|jgi:hypothetical protein|nr:DUF4321 domain-containing protein [Candidatus Neomarinimicrobiota bacterium]MCK9559109.1 DUF4321 domain-containing protein [Candidatus Neomarinimicrobiota bacterium]MDD5060812.1 DUF4321 domain-containing protein [Candidatus Neomarinimicrobiota bacterium]MDD5229890.1 DUF4321 domain-containing protein [Candidatus Neomarinimicrobiota bacterium]MDD5540350.1 DUF4321 domain-containing protein [Candidatus Neomarinimicrobiota bacterium]
MDKTKRKIPLILVIGVLLLGAMLGSLLGELLKMALPDGVVKEVFLRSIDVMLGPAVIDLLMFSVTLGLTLKFNFIGIIGIAVAYYILRFWR